MTKYVYRDKRKVPPVIMLEVFAESILEADALYKAAGFGDPVKQPYIGCERVENVPV